MNSAKRVGLTGAVLALAIVLALAAVVTTSTRPAEADSESNNPATGVPTLSGTVALAALNCQSGISKQQV